MKPVRIDWTWLAGWLVVGAILAAFWAGTVLLAIHVLS